MTVIRSLWAMVQGDPCFMRRVNGWLTVFFVILTPVSIATRWIYSVGFVSVLSLVALILGSLAAYQAARVEVRQDEIEQERRAEAAGDQPAAQADS